MADNSITVPVGSLAVTTTDATFENSGDMKLIFSGSVPSVLIQSSQIPTAASLTFSSDAPIRAYGLQLVGQSLSLKIDRTAIPGLGSLSFSSDVVTAFLTIPATSHVVAPSSAALGFSSDAPSVEMLHTSSPASGSIGFTGNISTVEIDITSEIFFTFFTFRGKVPTISIDYVGGSPGDGTLIQNLDAGPEASNYEICDRSGFKTKPFKDPLVEDPYGNLVRAESADPGRHPQERVKSTSEDYRTGALRPEPVGDETFLSDDDPVTPDDL